MVCTVINSALNDTEDESDTTGKFASLDSSQKNKALAPNSAQSLECMKIEIKQGVIVIAGSIATDIEIYKQLYNFDLKALS